MCLSDGEQTLRARALADTLVGSYDFATLVTSENQRKAVFIAELWQDGILISRSVTPFVANKHMELRKPGIKVRTRVEGESLCVEVFSRYLARFVELSIDGTDAVFSDNYFDIPAGTVVTVNTPLPESWTTESTVQVRSLYDSFA
jgi:beta-mannosidase